jgi:N-acetylmuramic acid 6-phosphate etherase
MLKNNTNTESIALKNKFIDKMFDEEAILFLIEDQIVAANAVKKSFSNIKKASKAIYNHLKHNNNGRLIYIGAGTSGRIGVQDGIELIPTFGWDSKRLDFILAGGRQALVKSIENAEDDIEEAKIKVIKKKINKKDVVIAISASGSTPFTVAAVKESKKNGALTIGISNNQNTLLRENVDISINLLTGAEAVAGSTRLKAGTAQKICLNTISTFVMAKFGRVKNGRMLNLIPMNKKLRERLKLIKSFSNNI